MPAQLKVDQDGLPEGTPGVSRTDGLDDGSLVTLTNTGAGATTTFRLLWVPPGDTTAVESLAPTEAPKVWTFEPTPGVYGSYRIELIENLGLSSEVRERRILVVRTPVRGLVIPAFGERADSRASLEQAEQAQIDAAENNADDFSESSLNGLRYAGWWRAIHELVLSLESAGGLPSGSYIGEPLAWDGFTWTPRDSITVAAVTGTSEALILTATDGGAYWITPREVGGVPQTQQHLFTSNDGSGGFPRINLRLGEEEGAPTIGFLGAAAVTRRSIEGTTTQEQVDSLVSALVTLGLVTDDRA